MQHEAVVAAMRRNGGRATLGWLNENVRVADWPTKTPFASIRRIVQQRPEFFKIRPGLWALEEARPAIEREFLLGTDTAPRVREELDHTYYQGLLVEVGNYEGYDTYVPPQDKNRLFLGKRLAEVATFTTLPLFTYDRVLARARTIDVIWFNKEGFPKACYEIEHATDFANSLDKYVALQDFLVDFRVVANVVKERDYQSKRERTSVRDIKDRVQFLSYDQAAEMHTKFVAAHALRQLLRL